MEHNKQFYGFICVSTGNKGVFRKNILVDTLFLNLK